MLPFHREELDGSSSAMTVEEQMVIPPEDVDRLRGVNESFKKNSKRVWMLRDDALVADMVLRGVPRALRGEMWLSASGAKDWMLAAAPGTYGLILGEHEGKACRAVADVEKDVHRTVIDPVFLSPAGRAKLRRVLVACAWHLPHVGYCQSMNVLAAFLLLHLDEEEAFWSLAVLVQLLLPSYFEPRMRGVRVDQRILGRLVQTHLPALHTHLEQLGVDAGVLTFRWFMTMFVGILPVPVTLRIWDAAFFFGGHVVFQVALELLSRLQADVLCCDDCGQVMQLLNRSIGRHVDLGLVHCALRRWGGGVAVGSRAVGGDGTSAILDSDKLDRLRHHYTQVLAAEDEEQKELSAERGRRRLKRYSAVNTAVQNAFLNAFRGPRKSLFGMSPLTRSGKK
eukprot:g3729.t1